jgi:hypothetical protein
VLAHLWLLHSSQAAIGSQLMSVAGVFSHLPHSIDTLTALSTVKPMRFWTCLSSVQVSTHAHESPA